MDQAKGTGSSAVDLWDAFDGLRGELERSFGSFDLPGVPGLLDWQTSPCIDLVETDDEVIAVADLPGVGKGDLELSIAGNLLSLKGEKRTGKKGREEKTVRKETWVGGFSRTIELPRLVDPEKVEAALKDGVLTVRIAKRDEARKRRVQIAVK